MCVALGAHATGLDPSGTHVRRQSSLHLPGNTARCPLRASTGELSEFVSPAHPPITRSIKPGRRVTYVLLVGTHIARPPPGSLTRSEGHLRGRARDRKPLSNAIDDSDPPSSSHRSRWEWLGTPKTITKPPACDDEGACAAGFLLDGVFVGLDCTPIKESAVTPVVIAAGRVSGEDVTVNVIDGVDPAVMMAISLPGGGCSEDDLEARRSAWSLAIPDLTDHDRRREAVCRVGDLTEQLLLANGCDGAAEVDRQRYSVDDLRDGVAVSVDDAAGAVDSATVFLPDVLPSYLSLHPQIDQQRVAVQHPGEGGFDAVVVYRTGPFCGVLPNVAVSGDEAVLTVEIATLGDGGE